MTSRTAPRSSIWQSSAAIALSLLGLVPSLSCNSDVSDPELASQSSRLTLGPSSVLTRNYNNQRTGANIQETALTQANVKSATFGKLFHVSVDDQVYAGILYASQVSIGGVNRDVIYVATVNNTVYAFDAKTGSPIWQRNFNNGFAPTNRTQVGNSACGGNYVDFSGNIGIIGTPVIDAGRGVIYFVSRTVENGTHVQRLRAIRIQDGLDRTDGFPSVAVMGSPNPGGTGVISVNGSGEGSSGGKQSLNPMTNNQRPGLALAGSTVYVGWSSFCDQRPYNGWLAGFNADSLAVTSQFATAPFVTMTGMAGIWMGGAAPAFDTAGNMYAATGNGDWDGNTNFGESVLKLTSTLARSSFFTPAAWSSWNGTDDDLGSTGPIVLPGQNVVVNGSKKGLLFVMSTTNADLGGMHSGDTGILQPPFQAVNLTEFGGTHHIHNAPVAWNSPAGLNLYIWGENDRLRVYRFNPGTSTFNTTAVAVGNITPPPGMPGGMMALSANGSTGGTGILWATIPKAADANHAVVPGVLRAMNAETAVQLWDSSGPDDDQLNFAKFNVPVVADGRVYVGSFSNSVSVYGLRGTAFSGTPVALPGTIEAENFDFGGENVGYHDSEAANQGGAWRSGGVDIQATNDVGGGFNVGWTAAGEWLKYSVNITGGTYNISARVASAAGGGSFRVEVDGTDMTSAITVPSTGAWTTWTTVTNNNVTLPAGNHVLRVFEITAGFNLNNLTFALNAPTCTTAADCNDNNPCTVDACTSGSCTHNAGNAGTVCRAAAGICDQQEVCSGASTTCPADTFLSSSTVCRTAAGVCDQAESCTGSSTACPADGFLSAATVCRTAVDLCDQAETCTGSSAACPADGIKPSGAVCRAAVGTCDTAETCDGSSTACPADAILPAGTTCRAAAGACDVAETCTGASGVCPMDSFVTLGTQCRASAGVCDVAESCNGSSAACPNDGFAPNTTVCRTAVDLCDQAESCTGSSAACPADAPKAAGTVCRAAANQCDAAESCNGSSMACPADALAPNGTTCNDGNSGTCGDVCTGGVCGGTTCSSQAFGGTPRSITTTIQAEDFDINGEGAGYHDTTPANQGGQYRTTEAVDIEATTDTNGGFNVGFVATGEWMNYSVTVATAGSYKVNLRVASMTAAQTMHLEVDGKNVTGAITIPNTNGWQTWQTVTANLKAFFTAGNHVVRLTFDTISATNGGINVNWFTFIANPGPFGGTVRSMTGTVQAEDFDLGGEGIAYHDAEAANQGGQYRTTEGVDIEATTDAGGGFNVGWTAATEYLVYTASNAATVGTVNLRVASTAAQTVHVEVDGVNVSGTISIPNTTGWQTWQTVTKALTTTVPAGTHLVRIVLDSGGINLNWVSFN